MAYQANDGDLLATMGAVHAILMALADHEPTRVRLRGMLDDLRQPFEVIEAEGRRHAKMLDCYRRALDIHDRPEGPLRPEWFRGLLQGGKVDVKEGADDHG